MTRIESAERITAHAGLLDWLGRNQVEFELHEHPLTFTARETARAEGVDPSTFAKVVGVITSDGRRALLVVEADDHVDLLKARQLLDTGHVRLLEEDELIELAPDCAVGTIPPVGDLFDVTVYADHAIRERPEISFHAGSHRHAVRVDRAAWERATNVLFGDLAVDREGIPAWALS
jgi:Ala-tRNA(Pro) deacylase